jgi:hypothetical protein
MIFFDLPQIARSFFCVFDLPQIGRSVDLPQIGRSVFQFFSNLRTNFCDLPQIDRSVFLTYCKLVGHFFFFFV